MQYIRQDELSRSVFGIFFQQVVEDRLGFEAVLVEEVLLLFLQPVRSLSPGPQRSIERHMTKQIKGVGLWLIGSRRQAIEINAAFL